MIHAAWGRPAGSRLGVEISEAMIREAVARAVRPFGIVPTELATVLTDAYRYLPPRVWGPLGEEMPWPRSE